VSRITAICISVFLLLLLVTAGVTGYEGYRRLNAMNARVEDLGREVHHIGQLAEASAESAHAADAHATEAANNARAAAGARVQAEQLQKQAESRQSQAETAAQQAQQQADQAQQQADQARDQLAELRRQREAELNHVQEVLSHIVATRRTQSGLVISLPDSTFKFDFDSSELKPKNRELLSRIAGILLVVKGYGLSVYGYSDDVGTQDYNQKLSVRRAQAVREYLVNAGIDAGVVNVKGFGKTSPLVEGHSEAARSKNRRVEIALTDTMIKYGAEVPGR